MDKDASFGGRIIEDVIVKWRLLKCAGNALVILGSFSRVGPNSYALRRERE